MFYTIELRPGTSPRPTWPRRARPSDHASPVFPPTREIVGIPPARPHSSAVAIYLHALSVKSIGTIEGTGVPPSAITVYRPAELLACAASGLAPP